MWTQALLYTQKAQLFADSAFVVGYDTAIRLVAQRYYNDDEAEMLSELKGMRSRGCQVLVAGRVDKDGAFRTLEDIKMSTALQELVSIIPAFSPAAIQSSWLFSVNKSCKHSCFLLF